MSTTTTYTGVRIVDMPDLGAVTDNSSVVGEHVGSGRFSALALRTYIAGTTANVRDYGAIGDGNTHPLSSVTSYLGYNTAGWTLTQWQSVFPFATALTNELDHCAVMAAIIAAVSAGKAVWIPSGVYRAAETLPITLATAGPLAIFGDGRGATRCASYGAFDWFNLTVQGAVSVTSSISFRELSVYQASNVLGGQGIAITGPVANSGRPTVAFEHCDIGNVTAGPAGTLGAFAVGANCLQITTAYASGCNFAGSQTSGGANQGVGIRVNGNSTFISFGPVVTGCQFYVLDKGVQAGDGTAAWIQGVQVETCNIVACTYGVHWVVGTSPEDNDGLTFGGTTVQCTTGILADGIQVLNVTGNYFLCLVNGIGIHIQNTRNNNCFLTAAGNSFLGFNQAGSAGVKIDGVGVVQAVYNLTGNLFQSFSGSGSVPVVLASGSKNVTLSSNTFSDCATPTDAGTNAWYSNISVRTNPAAATMFLTGIPGPAFARTGGLAWEPTGTTTTYWDPAAFSGAGAVHHNGALQVDGQFYTIGNFTAGSIYVAGDATLAGRVGFQDTAAIAKPTVTGAKGGNAALASLMSALANYGLVTDSTT